jgi:Fe-coproporphyrin III synthase
MLTQSLYHTVKRFRTLQTGTISALPIVILMPHSSCNCQCIMCDIWKDNKNLRQLNEGDITGLLSSLIKFGTQEVVMSGGEALLNPNFFRFCEILKNENIKITLLSTGISIKRNASQIVKFVDNIIVSLDGSMEIHDRIRNIPGAFNKLKEGVEFIKSLRPSFRITGRTVIHRLNFRNWPEIIHAAKSIGLDQVSFLPADVSSQAFNRELPWSETRQHEILLQEEELPELAAMLGSLLENFKSFFQSKFIAESPEKIKKIYVYYAAFYGHNPFPFKKCNAPWVSTVIEADGSVRPCFFHESLGNIREEPLDKILNSVKSNQFRKNLNIHTDSICTKCVCYLNLPPGLSLR